MASNLDTRTLGFRWLFGAGLAAIILAYVLFSIDESLSNSDVEIVRGETIGTLRGAQTMLPSRVSDARQLQNFSYEQADSHEADHSAEAHH